MATSTITSHSLHLQAAKATLPLAKPSHSYKVLTYTCPAAPQIRHSLFMGHFAFGSGEPQRLTAKLGATPFSFSPDGKRLAFSQRTRSSSRPSKAILHTRYGGWLPKRFTRRSATSGVRNSWFSPRLVQPQHTVEMDESRSAWYFQMPSPTELAHIRDQAIAFFLQLAFFRERERPSTKSPPFVPHLLDDKHLLVNILTLMPYVQRRDDAVPVRAESRRAEHSRLTSRSTPRAKSKVIERLSIIAGLVALAYAYYHPIVNITHFDPIAHKTYFKPFWQSVRMAVAYFASVSFVAWAVVNIVGWISTGFKLDRK